ncbi:hypothetical protein [Tannerella sp.]|uniref:hypothetical protein n=1 Tax=Tannerella sp. TaxID=2382127 RepID=UPI003FA2E552
MKRIILTVALSTLAALALWAQETAEKAFTQLTWIDANVEGEYSQARFGYDKSTFTVVRKRCETLPTDHPCYDAENTTDYVLVGTYQNASMTSPIYILYTPGMSADPAFRIVEESGRTLLDELADELCIHASGIIYMAGHTNKMINERRKYTYTAGHLTETPQPYLYAGIKGKLRKPVTLYSDRTRGVVVANLPVGYEVEVLLSENTEPLAEELPKHYLVRTAFGLVGWLRLTDEDMYYLNPVVQGLGYMGD